MVDHSNTLPSYGRGEQVSRPGVGLKKNKGPECNFQVERVDERRPTDDLYYIRIKKGENQGKNVTLEP
jgi:hypothetical protein